MILPYDTKPEAMAKAAAKKTTTVSSAARKTTPAKKSTKPKKEYQIKYEDKSAGQPQLVPIFQQLAELMEPYAKGSVQKRGGDNGQLSLVSVKPVEVAGKKMDELWFSGLLVQKGYVGFYYMPVYVAEKDIKPVIPPELLKCLKGKSCFHIKKLDDTLLKQINDVLKKGYALYRKNGWIS